MSRVGKKIISIPKDVTVTLTENILTVKGKHGSLEREIKDLVDVTIDDSQLSFKRNNEEKATKAYHGLIRALTQNMVTGVSELFSKTLVAEGVGYKFQVDAKKSNFKRRF